MKRILERLKVENRTSWNRSDVIGIAIVMVAIFAWTFTRVRSINPAILGDEYLYSLNARHADPWAASPAGDFSNYLFNLVFSATNLCGDSFYACAKGLNSGFFVLTVMVTFAIARKYLPTTIALAVSFLAGLSPLSVYSSMMLPESMYFFALSLVLLSLTWALDRPLDPFVWSRVGFFLGIATLVKPHAWLTSMGIAIFIFVASLGTGRKLPMLVIQSLVAFFGVAALTRVVIGLLIAGPKALGFFGIYLNSSIVSEFVLPEGTRDTTQSAVGTTPLNGALSLFWSQLQIHSVTTASLMSISFLGLVVAVFTVAKSRSIRGPHGLGLFLLIWGLSMMIAVVLFSGWITGGGDDHSTRVLLRYYEFFFFYGPIFGFILLWLKIQKIHIAFRWSIVGVVGTLISLGFTGFFGGLTIQIADAPSLAGLVVDEFAYNSLAVLSAVGLLAFATFPNLTKWPAAAALVVGLAFTGWNIQDQYLAFRGSSNPADVAGQKVRLEAGLGQVLVLGNSRFEVTNASFWVDQVDTSYLALLPGSQYPVEEIPEAVSHVILLSDVSLTESTSFYEIDSGDGYSIFYRSD